MRSAAVLAVGLIAACTSGEAPQTSREPKAEPTFTATLPAAKPALFKAIGTEPFWSIQTGPNAITYSTPEIPDGVGVTVRSGFTSDGLEAVTGDQIYFWEGKLEERGLRLEIKRGQCSDGMSDTVYAYTARLTIGDRTEQGCAKKL